VTRRSERQKAVARAVFDVWNSGALDLLDELVSVDVVHHDPLDPNDADGLGGMKRTIAAVRKRFPALHLSVEDQLAEGDRVATRWTGQLSYGRSVSGITVDRYENHKIVEAWRTIVDLPGACT
jgi:ketosteroid isomerase-like protein